MKTILILVMLTLKFSMTFAQNYGTITDSRDGKIYKTIKIGEQTWMAENLKFEPKNGSCCYEHEDFLCETYGRLYTLKVANYVCPLGWHLPSANEFDRLLENVGGKEQFNKLLKGGGSGFDALFSGWNRFHKDDQFIDVGEIGYFWTSSQIMTNDDFGLQPWVKMISPRYFSDISFDIYEFASVRCIKD